MDVPVVENQTQSLTQMSGEFLLAVKMEEGVGPFIASIGGLEEERLKKELSSDARRNAFWINLYNAFNLHLMRSKALDSKSRKTRMGHFFKKQIRVAGKDLSLVDLENGILRRSKTIWGLGYVGKLFPGRFERQHRIDRPDPRVHFALNCGAESCPPIRFYTMENIDVELDLATRSYLATEVSMQDGEVKVSALFNMYRGDFGGKQGAWKFIRKYRKDLPESPQKLTFLKWDWTQNLEAFA